MKLLETSFASEVGACLIYQLKGMLLIMPQIALLLIHNNKI